MICGEWATISDVQRGIDSGFFRKPGTDGTFPDMPRSSKMENVPSVPDPPIPTYTRTMYNCHYDDDYANYSCETETY